MLLKLTQSVFVLGQPGVDYRPYSKTCPAPPPPPAPKRWVTKTVCGTITRTAFVNYEAGVYNVGVLLVATHYFIDGYVDYTTIAPAGAGSFGTTPFCKKVTVYE